MQSIESCANHCRILYLLWMPGVALYNGGYPVQDVTYATMPQQVYGDGYSMHPQVYPFCPWPNCFLVQPLILSLWAWWFEKCCPSGDMTLETALRFPWKVANWHLPAASWAWSSPAWPVSVTRVHVWMVHSLHGYVQHLCDCAQEAYLTGVWLCWICMAAAWNMRAYWHT